MTCEVPKGDGVHPSHTWSTGFESRFTGRGGETLFILCRLGVDWPEIKIRRESLIHLYFSSLGLFLCFINPLKEANWIGV